MKINQYRSVKGLEWMRRELKRLEELLASGVAQGHARAALKERWADARKRFRELGGVSELP